MMSGHSAEGGIVSKGENIIFIKIILEAQHSNKKIHLSSMVNGMPRNGRIPTRADGGSQGGIEFVLKKIPPPFFFRERIMKKECLLLERSNREVVFVHLV